MSAVGQWRMVRVSACSKWRVWIHTCGAFSVFMPFLFDSWEEGHGAEWNKTGSGRFYTRTTATLMVAQNRKTKVWTRCLSQPRTTWIQFFVIVLHCSCRLLETSVAVVKDLKKKKKVGGKADHAHFPLQRTCGSGTNHSMVWKKNPQRRRMPFHCCFCTACMDSQFKAASAARAGLPHFYQCTQCSCVHLGKATILTGLILSKFLCLMSVCLCFTSICVRTSFVDWREFVVWWLVGRMIRRGIEVCF